MVSLWSLSFIIPHGSLEHDVWNMRNEFDLLCTMVLTFNFYFLLCLCTWLKNVTSSVFCPPRCSVCCDHLTNWYYEKDGKLYCRKHYWEKFGELCHGCSLLMTGPAMVRLLLPLFNAVTHRQEMIEAGLFFAWLNTKSYKPLSQSSSSFVI